MKSLARGTQRTRGGGDSPQYPDWRTALDDAIREPEELCRLLRLPLSLASDAALAAGKFPLLVPRTFVSRIRPGDPRDPLLAQVLPRSAERDSVPEFTPDPLGEATTVTGPGLLRKYRNRLLMVATSQCAVHCRFCFRRHFPYHRAVCDTESWGSALAQLSQDETIHEVIFSGGDPLALDDRHLAEIARQLAVVPHLRRLRLHTRLPIMIPQRVTEELTLALRSTRLTPIIVVHINHPAEIDGDVARALGELVDGGIPVLSQSVLLRGINDQVEVLAELFECLTDLRVLPYYLHQLDRVAGAAHFEVPESLGGRLVSALRARLPGYAVPRYVRETRGGPGKEVLA